MSSGVPKISFMTCPDSFRRSRSWSPVAAARRGQRESHNDVSSKALAITGRNVPGVLRLLTRCLLCWVSFYRSYIIEFDVARPTVAAPRLGCPTGRHYRGVSLL